jgi:cytochrome P450
MSAGFHHATSKDDVYQGYRIPAGTRIIPNAYSIHMDESKYPDPDTYEPMRYINYTLSATEAVNLKDGEQRGHFGYGAGRRVCAGMYVAEASLFIAVSKLLWTFNISYAKDESGQDILIDTMGYDGKFCPRPQTQVSSSTLALHS